MAIFPLRDFKLRVKFVLKLKKKVALKEASVAAGCTFLVWELNSWQLLICQLFSSSQNAAVCQMVGRVSFVRFITSPKCVHMHVCESWNLVYRLVRNSLQSTRFICVKMRSMHAVTCPWTSLCFLRKTCGSVAREKMFPMTGMGDGPGGNPGGLLCLTSWRTNRKARRATAKQPKLSRASAQDTGIRVGDFSETIFTKFPVFCRNSQSRLRLLLLGTEVHMYHPAHLLSPASKQKIGQKVRVNCCWTLFCSWSIIRLILVVIRLTVGVILIILQREQHSKELHFMYPNTVVK